MQQTRWRQDEVAVRRRGSAGTWPRPRASDAVWIWGIGAGAPVVRLWTQGGGARLGAAIVAVTSLAMALVWVLDVEARRRWVGLAALLAFGELASVPWVGRAPVLVAAIGTAVVAIALDTPGIAASRWSWRTACVLAAPVGGAIAWLATGSNSLAVLAACASILAIAAVRRIGTHPRRDVPPPAVDTAGSGGLPTGRIAAAAVFVSTVGVTAPIFWRLNDATVFIRGTNDVNSGIPRIEYLRFWPLRLGVAHPVWMASMKLLFPIVGQVAAITWVHAIATGAAAVLLLAVARSRFDDAPALGWPLSCCVALGLLAFENPAVLVARTAGPWGRFPAAGEFARGTGYLPLHQWATPTIVLSVPFAILLFVLVLQLVRQAEAGSSRLRRTGPALAALTVFTSLLQPATTLALLPAVPLYLLVSRRWRWTTVRAVAAWFALPGALVCLGQVWFLASDVSPYEQASWHWRPFWMWSHFGLDHVGFWLTLGFFVVCLAGGGRRYAADPAVAVSAIAFVVSLTVFLLLQQTTVAAVPDGDLGVLVMMSLMLLFVASLRFVALEVQASRRRRGLGERWAPPTWLAVALFALVVMLSAGVVDLLGATGVAPQS